jgi:hypothetical protein
VTGCKTAAQRIIGCAAVQARKPVRIDSPIIRISGAHAAASARFALTRLGDLPRSLLNKKTRSR